MARINLLNRIMLVSLVIGCWSCNGEASDKGQGRGGEMGLGKGRVDTTVEYIDSGIYSNGTALRKEYNLPDGTKLIMHAGTVVRLSKEFGKKDRELLLVGEAMLEVNGEAG